jgi:hypothetical protein
MKPIYLIALCLASFSGVSFADTFVRVPYVELVNNDEVPNSCGMPGLYTPAFWDAVESRYDCGALDIEDAHFRRLDSPVSVVDPGAPVEVFGKRARTRYCLSCCLGEDAEPIGEESYRRISELTISFSRFFEWTIGAEVSAGGEVGFPLVGQVNIEAKLSAGAGGGAETTYSSSETLEISVRRCEYKLHTISAKISEDAIWKVSHSYRLWVDVLCSEADPPGIVLMSCPNSRESRLRTDNWKDVDADVNQAEQGHCNDEQ